MKNQNGYSMIEIGVGLLIIAVFSFSSLALFNGCYNNYGVVEQRNIALSHAINRMEYILQEKDLTKLGFTGSGDDQREYDLPSASSNPIVDNRMNITTKFSRISSTGYDNTVLKVEVEVDYKVKVNDTTSRTLKLESVKVLK